MQLVQFICGFVLCGLVLSALSGPTQAATVTQFSPQQVAQNQLAVYLYNPATKTIARPLGDGYADGQTVMLPWTDYDQTWAWTLIQSSTPGNYYISAVTPSAVNCNSGGAYLVAVQGHAVSIVCAADPSSATPFLIPPSFKPINYLLQPQLANGNSGGSCVTIVSGVPTTPAAACVNNIAATQWQFVTIS